MSQQVRIGRDLVFLGGANWHPNIEGNPMFDKVVFYDDFVGKDIRAEWNSVSDNGGTVAITAGSGGTVTITTGGTSEDRGILTFGLNFYPAQKPYVFARVQVDNITTVCLNVGFSDALTEADNHLAYEIDAGDSAMVCTNGAGWVFDTDATADYWHTCNKDGTTGAITAYGTNAPVNETYVWLGVGINSDGDATYFYNGSAVAFKETAVTSTTPLTPFFGCMARTTAARVMTIDKVYLFQDEA